MTQLYLITDPTGHHHWLSDYPDEDEGYQARPATDQDLTPDRIAHYLDQNCENDNAHTLVGTHTGLLKLLNTHADTPTIHQIFLDLLDHGGIRGLR